MDKSGEQAPLSTYFEQLHSRHLVRSLTGSCTACGCLQEHSGLHIVTSNPFLSVQQAVKKDYLLHGLPPREEGLAYFFWPSKHVDIVGTLATVLETSSSRSTLSLQKFTSEQGAFPNRPFFSFTSLCFPYRWLQKQRESRPSL